MLKRIQETLKRNDICIAFAILLFYIYIAALSNYYSYMINVLSSIGACTFGVLVARAGCWFQNFIRKELDL